MTPEEILSTVAWPGIDVISSIKEMCFLMASERQWVLTGGWAAHAYTGDIYESDTHKVSSDLDVLCLDPASDLTELASRIRKRFPMLTCYMHCGMAPNLFHLELTGVSTLIDAVSISKQSLGCMITHEVPATSLYDRASLSEARLIAIDPMYELCMQVSIDGDVFKGGYSQTPKIEKRRRIAARLFDAMARNGRFVANKAVGEVGGEAGGEAGERASSALASAGFGNLVAWASSSELMVPASDAYDVIEVVARAFPASSLVIHSPFVFPGAFVLALELVSEATRLPLLRIFVTPTPVPVAEDGGDAPAWASPRLSRPALAYHMCLTAAWRASLEDRIGARQRWRKAREVIYGVLSDGDADLGWTAKNYSGRLPSETIYYTWRRFSDRKSCGLSDYDGRVLTEIPIETLLSGGREGLRSSIASVTPRNIMSSHMLGAERGSRQKK